MNRQARENPIDDQLQQQLWELVYDLLPEEEADALVARIGSDPFVARAYADVQLQAGVVRDALRSETPPLPLRAPRGTPAAAREKPRLPPAVFPSHRSRFANLLAPALAASLLLMLSYTVWKGNQIENRDPTRGGAPVRTTVLAPAAQIRGVASPVTVLTRHMTGEPVATSFTAEVRDERDVPLWEFEGQTRPDGQVQLNIPLSFVDVQNSLRIQTRNNVAEEAITANFLVRETPSSTFLVTDRPVYEPGETIYFRSVTAPKLATDTLPEVDVDYEIQDSYGQVVPGLQLSQATEQGVASGTLSLERSASEGLYALVGRSPDGRFRLARREFVVQRDEEKPLRMRLVFDKSAYAPGERVVADVDVTTQMGEPLAGAELAVSAQVDDERLDVDEPTLVTSGDGAAQIQLKLPSDFRTGEGAIQVAVQTDGLEQSLVRTIPLQVPIAKVQLLPEGGNLVADVPNRLYFAASNVRGEPLALSGRLLDEQDRVAAELATDERGRGTAEFTPRLGTYRLELDAPAGWTLDTQSLDCSAAAFATLHTGPGVFPAGEPLEVALAANQSQRLLVAVASCGGVDVGQVAVATTGGAQLQPIELPVSDEAQGVLRITLFDADQSPPQAIAERLVYRRPAGQLQLRQSGEPIAIAGQRTQWSVEATNEEGTPTSATLGLAVIGGKPERRWGAELPAMETYFSLLDAIDDPVELEHADTYVAENPDAERALDLLLGTKGWRRIERTTESFVARLDDSADGAEAAAVVQPPQVYDNLAQIQQRQQRAEALEIERLQFHRAAARWLIPAAALVLVLVLALALFRLARAGVWVPSVGIATATLLLGLTWMGGSLGTPSSGDQSMLARSDNAAREVKSGAAATADERRADAPLAPSDALSNAPAESEAITLDKAEATSSEALAESVPAERAAPEEPAAPQPAAPQPAAPELAAPPPPAPLLAPEKAADRDVPRPDAEPPAPRSALAPQLAQRSRSSEPAPAEAAPAEAAGLESLEMQADPARAAAGTEAELQVPQRPLAERGARVQRYAEGAAEADAELRSLDRTPPAGNAARKQEAKSMSRALPRQTGERPQSLAAAEGQGRAAAGMPQGGMAGMGTQSFGFAPGGLGGGGRDIRRFRYQQSVRREPGTPSETPPVTLYWDPLVTAPDGVATFDFDTPSDLESVQLLAFGHAGTRFGTLREPVPISPPVAFGPSQLAQVRVGDVFRAPLIVSNQTRATMNVDVQVSSNELLNPTDQPAEDQRVVVAPQSTVTHWLPEQRVVAAGKTLLSVVGDWGSDRAVLEMQGTAAPQGPLIVWDQDGVLTTAAPAMIEIPAREQATSIELSVRGFPSQASELRDRLQTLATSLPAADPRLLAAAVNVRSWFEAERIGDPDLLTDVKRWQASAMRFAEPEQRSGSFLRFGRGGAAGPSPQTSGAQGGAETEAEAELEKLLEPKERLAAEALPAVTRTPVTLDVRQGEDMVAQLKVPANSSQAMRWDTRLSSELAAKKTTDLQLAVNGTDRLPYRLEARVYLKHEDRPPAVAEQNEAGKVTIATSVSAETLAVGEETLLSLNVTRREHRPVRIIVMFPGGTAADAARITPQLERAGIRQFTWEDQRLILAWPAAEMRESAAADVDDRLELQLPLFAQLAGRFIAPASTAYYINTADQPHFARPLTLEVTLPP